MMLFGPPTFDFLFLGLPSGFLLIVLIYLLFDVVLILRVPLSFFVTKYFSKRRHPLNSTSVYGMCLTQDVDYYLTHMNNNRISRELDMALYKFIFSSGIMQDIKSKHGTVGTIWKTASNVRFRRPISLFSVFKIKSKLVYWDANTFFMEQQITTRDNFVRAVALTKMNVAQKVDLDELLKYCEKPQPSEELMAWISINNCSSKRLRAVGAKAD